MLSSRATTIEQSTPNSGRELSDGSGSDVEPPVADDEADGDEDPSGAGELDGHEGHSDPGGNDEEGSDEAGAAVEVGGTGGVAHASTEQV